MNIEITETDWSGRTPKDVRRSKSISDFFEAALSNEIEGNELAEAKTLAYRSIQALGRLAEILASKGLLSADEIVAISGLDDYPDKLEPKLIVR